MKINDNVLFIGAIVALTAALIFVSVAYFNGSNKAELNQLKKDNTTLNSQVKQLTADGQGAHQDAARFEQLYAKDTTRLAGLQFKFDSLTGVLTHLKSITHAQTKAIGLLNDAATDSLYSINKARLSQLVNQ